MYWIRSGDEERTQGCYRLQKQSSYLVGLKQC
jgi:hypothetical protein